MRRGRGFTLIELLVVISVVALTFGVALDRLTRYQELAERTAMEQNLAAINIAVTMKFAALVTSGRAVQIEDDVGSNPAKLMARMPENYLGELYSPDPASVPKESWYYDLHSGDFVYVPARTRYLTIPKESAGNLRFRIVLTEAAKDPAAPREFRQPYISAVFPYRWVID
ncbi:MAG TPA: type II secretion system protein [Burkholderiales bacterium]